MKSKVVCIVIYSTMSVKALDKTFLEILQMVYTFMSHPPAVGTYIRLCFDGILGIKIGIERVCRCVHALTFGDMG